MKLKLLLCSLIFFISGINTLIRCDTNCQSGGCCPTCSHTFLRARPSSQDASLEMNQWHYYLAHIKDAHRTPKKRRIFSAGGTFFYQRSTHTSSLREFFLKNCNDCSMTIAQSPIEGPDPVADINASWLQINANPATPFSSRFTLNPKRELFGGMFNVNFDFGRWAKGLSLAAIIPVVHVKHHIGFKETSVINPGIFPGITNAQDAFNNPAWNYGKISPCGQSKTGVDDIHLKLQWRFLQKKRYGLGLYGSLFIPTHHGSKARSLFEPTIGNGGHVGLGGGLHAGFVISKGKNHLFTLFANARYAYFLKAHERRSLDLCPNGEWSRYLLVAREGALETALPGINFFTREVNVTPRSNAELIAAFHYNYKHWNFELGYNYWFRQKEKIAITCNACDPSTVGIFDLPHVLNAQVGPFTTASTAQINQAFSAVQDATAIFVTNSDLNLNSAAHPRASSCKLYGSAGYDFDCCKYPLFTAIGASYEWGHKRSALSQWGISTKTGISF